MKKGFLTVLTAVSLVFATAGQAQAFNLLVAVGNPSIQVVIAGDGSLEIVKVSKPDQEPRVEDIEPAAG